MRSIKPSFTKKSTHRTAAGRKIQQAAVAHNWSTLIKEWEKSKLTQQVFCTEKSINYASFVYHRERLKKRRMSAAPKLLPIQKMPDSITQTAPAGFVVSWPNGVTLRATTQTDISTFTALLDHLHTVWRASC